MNKKETIRLLIVSHQLTHKVRQQPFELKKPEFAVVGNTDNLTLALDLYTQLRPHILILDTNLLPISYNFVTCINRSFSDIKILLITTHYGIPNLKELIGMGVRGCIHQTEYIQTVINAVCVLYLGGLWFKSCFFHNLIQQELEPGNNSILTNRETEVLQLVAGGLNNKTIARSLGVKERTIEFHMTNILQKLHTTSRVTAVLWAKGNKLIND